MEIIIRTHKPIEANENHPLPHWELDSLKSINWNNSSDRKWLTNHMHWAFHNNRRVIVMPVTCEKTFIINSN